ncbi:LysR family transcriptional regulator [Celerinatantimonas yamalensis]|uniref:LysR family transcriptional regulator n=1 Tax=Celerinatantimonas yamalensis TaxID=559956 RepID=A0ABW9GAZ4_9GAMM
MNLDDMAYFALIAKAQGISKAASRYKLSKSLLSRRLKHLEQQLGVTLVERNVRQFHLTEVGEKLAKQCLQLLEQADIAEKLVSSYLNEPQGRLHIIAPMAFIEQILSPLLAGFLQHYPLINVELQALSQHQTMKSIDCDLYLSLYTTLPDTPLYAKAITSLHDVLVCSPSFAQQHHVDCAEDLIQLPLLSRLGSGTSTTWQLKHKSGTTHQIEFVPRMTSNSLSSLLESAVQSCGIALLPTLYCVEKLKQRTLVQINSDYTSPSRTLYGFYKIPLERNRLVALFLNYLQTRLPE